MSEKNEGSKKGPIEIRRTEGQYEKPVPQIHMERASRRFWDGLKEGRLFIPECQDCGNLFFPPSTICPDCLSEDIGWHESDGKGEVYTFTASELNVPNGFSTPVLQAIVKLDDGVSLLTRLVDVEPDEVRIGMPVEPIIEEATPEFNILLFKPRD